MHELAICQALLEQVEWVARENDARRVVSIVNEVGPLSGVEPRLLEHASLRVETPPVRVRCRSCGAESDAQPNRIVSGGCGDWQVET